MHRENFHFTFLLLSSRHFSDIDGRKLTGVQFYALKHRITSVPVCTCHDYDALQHPIVGRSQPECILAVFRGHGTHDMDKMHEADESESVLL